MVDSTQITGLVLAGGQGSRLGGVDKGLQTYRGQSLAWTATQRLALQVTSVLISANRHLEQYARWGYSVWPDPGNLTDYQGPLAGLLSGLQHCHTPYLASVPCDCPHFPNDLVSRLSAAIGPADIAMACSPTGREPTFCLMHVRVRASLEAYLASGERKFESWTSGLQRVEVPFDDASAFFNINTPDDLAAD